MQDFASIHQIRLLADNLAAWRAMSWHEFQCLLGGLLNTDSRVARHFAPEPTGDQRG